MAEMTKESVNVNLLGRIFPVKIDSSEVKILKEVEKELNSKLQNYITKFEGIDKEKALSMALISYAFDQKKTIRDFNEKEIQSRLNKVEKTLTSALHDLS